MTEQHTVFGLFHSAPQAETAVDLLREAGFAANSISVLHPDNASSREFAAKKQTRVPSGVADGDSSHLPLTGTAGILDPASGPKMGALSKALLDMGVPVDWRDERVMHGKLLLAADCETPGQTASAGAILRSTGAEDIATVQRSASPHSKPWDENAEPDIGWRNIS